MTQASAAKFEPLLTGTDKEMKDAVAKGAVDVSSRLELGFEAGSILYLVFDVVVLLMICQNIMRPKNIKENNFYSILIIILLFLGGLQLLLIFGNTMFTTAGSICAGAYLKDNANASAHYRISESHFIIWVTVFEIPIFLILLCTTTAYSHMKNRVNYLVALQGAVSQTEFTS